MRLALSLLALALVGCASTEARYPDHRARDGFALEQATLFGPNAFPRFDVPDRGEPLRAASLDDDELLLVVERGGARRALTVRELAYHHVAQGELAGEPYVVAF